MIKVNATTRSWGTSIALLGAMIFTSSPATAGGAIMHSPTHNTAGHANQYSYTQSGHGGYAHNGSTLGAYHGQSQWSSHPSTAAAYVGSLSSTQANAQYGTGSISQTYSETAPQIIPFSTQQTNMGHVQVPGLSQGEYLAPTNCPVDVQNPNGGTVLGCYKIARRVIVQRHVHISKPRAIRVVRPVVYVRYPVSIPVPYAVPVPIYGGYHTAHGYNNHTRSYGNSHHGGYSRYGQGHTAQGSTYGYGRNHGYGGNGCVTACGY